MKTAFFRKHLGFDAFRDLSGSLFRIVLLLLVPLGANADLYMVTSLNDSGEGSLRQAVLDANGSMGVADTIEFESGLTGTIILMSGEIVIRDPVTIKGPGADVLAVSGNDSSGIFVIQLGNVTIQDLTLRNGSANNYRVGGAIYNETGILNLSRLTLKENYAYNGGAIYNNSRLIGVDLALFGNNAGNEGGAIFNQTGSINLSRSRLFYNTSGSCGGAVYNQSIFNATDVNISGNSAHCGAGIYMLGSANLTLLNSILAQNLASSGGGGGIYSSSANNVSVKNSAFILNRAGNGGSGGGLYLVDFNRFSVYNSTLSNNYASWGGAVCVLPSSQSSDFILINSTLAQNYADNEGGGIWSDGKLKLGNIIVSDNFAPAGPEIYITDNGNADNQGSNVFGTYGNAGVVGFTPGSLDIVPDGGIETILGELADNGGPTQTHLPVAGSPIIDAGDNSLVPTDLTTDQRGTGYPRILNGTVDIGAVEGAGGGTTPTPTLSVTRAGTGSGTVTSTPTGIDCGTDCSEDYAAGTTVTLRAQPSTQVSTEFTGWSGACSGTGDCILTMDADKSVTATFRLATVQTYNLSVSKAGNGTVTSAPAGIDCGAACTAAFNSGTDVVLTARPATGAAFTGWTGACTGTDTTCTVKMDRVREVFATFSAAVSKVRLTVTKTGNGSLVSTPAGINCGTTCSADYDSGTSITLVATPDAGQQFGVWGGDCSGTNPSCTLSNVTSAKNVTATFQPEITATYGIQTTASPSDGGRIVCTPNPVTHGQSSTCTATADSGYRFSTWSGDCSGSDPSCTLSQVTRAQSVTAHFGLVGQPLATQSGPATYLPGGLLTITNHFDDPAGQTATSLGWYPNLPTGWTVVSAQGDGAPVVNNNQIGFTGNLRLPIEFSYQVLAPAGASGEQMLAARVEYQSNAMVNPISLTVAPNLLFNRHNIQPHSADYRDPRWQIDLNETNRVLGYWRTGAYHVNTDGLDDYAQGVGSTTGNRHAADYQEPSWRIDSFEANRVLAYWRAQGYRVDLDSRDGYAPGAQQTTALSATIKILAADAPQATHAAGSSQYTPGSTLTITNTVGRSGDRPLLGLVWVPKLPNGWTITEVGGDGAPELNPDRNQILFTNSTLTLPLRFTYRVQAPASAAGSQTLQADFEYWNDPSMVDPAGASLASLVLIPTGGAVGDCSRSEIVLNTSITGGTQSKGSESKIRTTGTVRVASGAGLDLVAPRITFTPGFRVEAGGRLRATSAPVTCTGTSAVSAEGGG